MDYHKVALEIKPRAHCIVYNSLFNEFIKLLAVCVAQMCMCWWVIFGAHQWFLETNGGYITSNQHTHTHNTSHTTTPMCYFKTWQREIKLVQMNRYRQRVGLFVHMQYSLCERILCAERRCIIRVFFICQEKDTHPYTQIDNPKDLTFLNDTHPRLLSVITPATLFDRCADSYQALTLAPQCLCQVTYMKAEKNFFFFLSVKVHPSITLYTLVSFIHLCEIAIDGFDVTCMTIYGLLGDESSRRASNWHLASSIYIVERVNIWLVYSIFVQHVIQTDGW